MSSNIPPDPAQEPEFLSQGATEPARKSHTKAYVLVGIGALAAGVIGVGAWGVAQLTGGGPGPAAVLPDTTLAYAALDLDPSASQKIEAIQTLKKFPAFAEDLDLDTRDDIRRWLVDKVRDEECADLDYEADVEPWLGNKAAVAAVPGPETAASPVVVLQVTDEDAATDGIARIFSECAPSEEHAVSFLDGYAVIAQTSAIATATTEAAAESSLADDSNYTDLLSNLGGLGIATFYISPDAPKAMAETIIGGGSSDFCADDSSSAGASPGSLTEVCEELDDAKSEFDDATADFKGGAGTLRFGDGGIELALAGSGIPVLDADGSAEPTTVSDLPATTIAALGISLADGWTSGLEQQLKSGIGGWYFDMLVDDFEQQSDLRFPEDLEAVLGDGFVVALDGETDFEGLASQPDPGNLRAGLRIDGDEAEIRRVIDGLLSFLGASSSDRDFVKVQSDGDRVAIGFNAEYLDELLAGGDLGDDDTFADAVAHADEATAALFVDFDAENNWLVRFADAITGGDQEVVQNIEPLDALGVSAWVEDDVSLLVLRLSTD